MKAPMSVSKPADLGRGSRTDTTRENPSSGAGFDAISSAGGRATSTALQLTFSSSAFRTRATTIDYISSAFLERATIS